VARLSVEEALQLLRVQALSEDPAELDRFRRWIVRLVESHGEAYVLQNRLKLLKQWQQYSSTKFTSCV